MDLPHVGAWLPIVRRVGVVVDLVAHGVAIHRQAMDSTIKKDKVIFTVNGQAQSVTADHVIVAKGAQGNLDLANQLKAGGFTTFTVGDCNGVGFIDGAINNAARTVNDIQTQMSI